MINLQKMNAARQLQKKLSFEKNNFATVLERNARLKEKLVDDQRKSMYLQRKVAQKSESDMEEGKNNRKE